MSQETVHENYEVWKAAELSKTFLEGVRGAIPLAAEQIEIVLRLVRLTQYQVNTFLDLGCGDGILGKSIYQYYPGAQGVFLDISETMLRSAQINLQEYLEPSTFILKDMGQSSWTDSFDSSLSFDVIVSGFAIHHQPDTRKKELYREIHDCLKPGGLFLNLEHVASRSQLGEKAFDELFIDSLYSFHRDRGSQQSKEEIDRQYYNRADKTANILSLVETQCDWLRDIGFVEVDCFMKLFEIALFGGLREQK